MFNEPTSVDPDEEIVYELETYMKVFAQDAVAKIRAAGYQGKIEWWVDADRANHRVCIKLGPVGGGHYG